MAERDRIARYFAPLTSSEPGSFGLTDDAALLEVPAGKKLVVTSDSVIETIHILPDASPQQFAQKLIRRNLSDLAAMGAMPWRYTLNMHTPATLNDDWFAEFSAALAAEQTRFNLVLIGGDSTSGGDRIHLTMTCFGLVQGATLRRNSAKAGDDLYVSGSIGAAAFALHLLQQNVAVEDALARHYHCPEPRLALGNALHGIANSALDISDGLLADIAQLCVASGVGARIERDAIPLLPQLRHAIVQDASAWRFVVSGGDDYELCFTAAPTQRAAIQTLATTLQLPLTRIGEMTKGTGIELRDAMGNVIPASTRGWEHA